MTDAALLAWLSSPSHPAARYLTARDLLEPRPDASTLAELRGRIMTWKPLRSILELQREDGSFPDRLKTPTARPTFWALVLMERCGLQVSDGPVARAIEFVERRFAKAGAVSYTGGGSGVLPCYAGVVTTTLYGLGAGDRALAQASLDWLVDHQRFDHKDIRAGGAETWPYRAPANFGCWESVSCYHGVAGAFRAFASVPAAERSPTVRRRLTDAIGYLRIHRLFRKSTSNQPLFRHMTRTFLVGDYRSGLLDMLQGVADADPSLVQESWVDESVAAMEALTAGGRVPLAMNYGRALVDTVPLEPIGQPSRLLTYQWLRVRRTLDAAR